MGRVKKEERQSYTVRLPKSLYGRIKAEQDATGKILNDLVCECIEAGLNQFTQPQVIKDGPQDKNKNGPYKVEIPQDVVESAKTAAAGIEADMPAIIRQWVKQGHDISHALQSGMKQYANNATPALAPAPTLNGKTAPQTPTTSSEPTESSKVGIVQRSKNRMQH